VVLEEGAQMVDMVEMGLQELRLYIGCDSMVVDRIEKFGEKMYEKRWFRVVMLIFFFVFHCYIALWIHEFWHYWYGEVVNHAKCYIYYAPFGIRGWTVCDRYDLFGYTIGGLGTVVVFFIYWFFAASFPSRLSLPYDFSMFFVVVQQVIYTVFEVIGLGMNHPEIYQFNWLSTTIGFITVTLLYWSRIKEYLEVRFDELEVSLE